MQDSSGVDDEGDVRYLAREVLQEQFTELPKADVFSLGLMAYEAAGGGPLPKEGDEWHALRNGELSVSLLMIVSLPCDSSYWPSCLFGVQPF